MKWVLAEQAAPLLRESCLARAAEQELFAAERAILCRFYLVLSLEDVRLSSPEALSVQASVVVPPPEPPTHAA
jgi:hypothetical protein